MKIKLFFSTFYSYTIEGLHIIIWFKLYLELLEGIKLLIISIKVPTLMVQKQLTSYVMSSRNCPLYFKFNQFSI